MDQPSVNKKNPKFVSFVLHEARKRETLDINDNRKNFLGRNLRRIFSTGAAIVVILTLRNGFEKEFLELVATILSIFIGLFITALIFAIDKYGNISINTKDNPDSRTKIFVTQSQNYIRLFNVLIGKNILLCVVTLALLGVNILYPEPFKTNPFNYKFANPASTYNITLFVALSALIIQRGGIIYLLVSIFYDTIRIVSTLVNYMSAYIDRK